MNKQIEQTNIKQITNKQNNKQTKQQNNKTNIRVLLEWRSAENELRSVVGVRDENCQAERVK